MSDGIILRPPYYKGKGYCTNPIVVNGIPKEADSRRDKKVIGTVAWEKFWEEQLYYIHNGYQTGGLWIPGRYYYYMNYSVISTVKGNINPDNDDLHLELAYLIDYCKLNGKNLMIPKARRKGISEATHKMVIDYGWRFLYSYKAGVASGKKDFVDDFLAKLRYGWMNLPPELYTNPLLNNDDEIIAGFSQKNESGAFADAGTMNTIYSKTVHTDASGFKGNYYNDIIVEEVGETEKLLEFWSGTKDALGDGNGNQVGSAFFYGTGGNMDKGSKDFKKAWSRNEKENFCEANGFIRFLIPAQRFYMYGSATGMKKPLPSDSLLYRTHKPYQLIGVEDTEASLKDILATRERLIKQSNKKDYYEYLQNNPINEQEIFAKTVVNNFDSEKLRDQNAIMLTLSHPKYTKYKLEWVKDDKGMIKLPLSVNRIALKPYEDQNVCIWMLDGGEPMLNFTHRYCAGIDSYNIDESKNSKSLGAMLVLDRKTKIPVAAICCRPKRKETFFEMCIMLSVHYKMIGNVLGDVASDTIIKHYEQHGCYGYLADRPKKFESEHSEQSHEKWVRLTDYSRPRMIGLMQAHVVDHCQDIWFPELLEQIGNYDEVARTSDNDLADAYGIALMQDLSYDVAPRNEEDVLVDNRYNLTKFVDDGKGGLKLQAGSNGGRGLISPEADGELFKDIFGL